MEHVLIFASIIIGLAIGDQLISLQRLLRERHHVRWDWATLAVALLVLLTLVQIWWSLTQPTAERMTIGKFMPLLVELIILFLLSAAVLPDGVPETGIDLKAYYDENGSYIWTLYSLALGWLIVTDILSLALNGESLGRILTYNAADRVILALMISLIFVRRRWWHLIVLLLLALGPIGWMSRSIG